MPEDLYHLHNNYEKINAETKTDILWII